MKRIYGHVAILSLVALVCAAQYAGAMPLPAPLPVGTSKAVYYSPGVMGRVARINGVWGQSPDGCYMSSPLSDDIGSVWLLDGPASAQPLRCVQADVSQPKHKRWQLREQRLIETDAGSMRRLVGFLPAPWEASITFRRIR